MSEPITSKSACSSAINVSAGPADFGFVFADVDVDAANKWVMLAVTYDSALADANTKFYIGGVATSVAQLGVDQTIVQLTVDGGAALMGVGYTDAAPTADTSVTGWQDDVRVYNTVLDLAALDAVRLENLGGGPVLAADFNNDTKVDDQDFDVWTTGYGLATGATKPQGNADADADIDGADFLVWQSEYGSGVTGAAAIPEPTSQLLAVLLSAAAIAGRGSAFAQARLSEAHLEKFT